ncbi:phosphoglycolate phosphatase 1A, chloroplastic-like isoform X1 [Malus sylvestris]|uniref:phosphoglycolate phosphatase 1A, chloroplastic-like isoform X1 n=1 Tax=Malus sylvestris TaxID=3752 RepID=UPI0021ACD526|nr:phosphoglycolate phosphatase 1A, chloroplastic-like isoform X1 [Malus sylvestris]
MSATIVIASASASAKSSQLFGFGSFGINSNNLSCTRSTTTTTTTSTRNLSWNFINSNKHKSRKSMMEDSFTTRASAQPLTNADDLIDSVETFIFDCDGVIWKGDKLIDGVPQTLDMLRSKVDNSKRQALLCALKPHAYCLFLQGKRLVFVTNNSTKSRKQYGKKFETLGLNVNEEEIFASSFAAAAYLKSINFPKDKKVYVIGEEGILKELELAGYQYLGGPEDGGKKIELKPGYLMEHDESVGAVVVGFDRNFNYYKIQYGTLCIRENPGCLFIATNRDAVTHLTDAQEWAGGGSMVGAISGSTQREPLVVGKPSTFMMDYLANEFGILKSQICMVGDRLDTDILFGQNGGCKTLLVLSGVTTLPVLQSPDNSIQPDFYTNKISDFLSLKAATV